MIAYDNYAEWILLYTTFFFRLESAGNAHLSDQYLIVFNMDLIFNVCI